MGGKDIKVLLVSPLPPPAGGIATWTKKYLDWCKKNNICVDVVNTAVIGSRAIQINTSRRFLDEVKRTILILKDLKNKLRLNSPHIVHLNTPCGKFGLIRDYFCANIVKKRNIPLVVHYRCNIEDQVKNSMVQKFFIRKISSIASINLVLNSPSKKYLENVSGQDSKLIANFIDDEFILREKKSINTKIKNIVFIGHVQITKGIKEIIEAASHFPKINFILAGPISSEIKSVEIPSNISLKGPVNLSEVRDLLYYSDVFLFPTYSEGFSNALLEAMAMGLPIITTNVGANADMIELSGGILVGVKNYKDITDAIKKLEDKKYRESISIWNITKAKESYLIDKVMEKLFSIYQTNIK